MKGIYELKRTYFLHASVAVESSLTQLYEENAIPVHDDDDGEGNTVRM